jgi:nitroreductase/dihydropteridine reductase
MEGFDNTVLDHELGLPAQGFTSTVIVSVGYHGTDDFNYGVAKSRFSEQTLFTDI